MTGPTARPRSTRSGGRTGRRVVAAVVAVLVAGSALLASVVVAGATPVATTTTTTVAPTTAAPTTAAPTTVAPTTTAPRAPVTSAPPLQERVTESEAATTRLNRVVIGLVGLAVVIALATVVFWRLTRPDRGARSPAATSDAGSVLPAPAPAAVASTVPGAGDATADDEVVRVVRRRRAGSGPGAPGGGR